MARGTFTPVFRHLLVLFSFLGLLGFFAGCGAGRKPEASRETIHDLIADLDLSEVQREPGLVDVGTPEARALLRKGWWLDEAEGGRTFAWSDGPESELEFFLTAPRDIPLTLRGTPYQDPGGPAQPPQKIVLVLNGETVGQVTAAPDGRETRVVLPQQHLRAGENLLALRYAWTRSPWNGRSGGAGSEHRRAVAWDLLRFETGMDEAGRVRVAGDRLALPFGWRVDSYLRLPAGATLTMDDLRLRGAQGGELRVTVRSAGGTERELARLHPGERPPALVLPDSGGLPVRLSLTAVPSATEGAAGAVGTAGSGLVLGRPAVVASPTKAAAAPAAVASLRPPRPPRPRNVILYLVDTLRADHLGCYGYGRPLTPHVDAFARQAALFRHTVAQSSWTRPSTTTILTGLLPRTHGIYGHRDSLAPEAVTLAERLRERGYRTAGFVTNPNVARDFGLDQGFETFQMLGRRHSSATDVNDRAAEWLDTVRTQDAPFFLYLHTMEPHAPYAPPPPFRQRFAPGVQDENLTRMRIVERLEKGEVPGTPEVRQDLQNLYDAEIAANDAAFGALIDLLVQRGLWEDTVVVFVSDHGEEFLDHQGWEHGKTLHNEMLDVPLIVRAPGSRGRVVEEQVQQADVVPTILDLLGLPVARGLEGRSLRSMMLGKGLPGTDAVAFSWLEERGLRAAAVTTPEWRLIEKRFPIPGHLLYDRRADPGEQHDLAGQQSVRAGYLRARLRAAERARKGMLQAGETTTLDPEVQKQLEALGYM